MLFLKAKGQCLHKDPTYIANKTGQHIHFVCFMIWLVIPDSSSEHQMGEDYFLTMRISSLQKQRRRRQQMIQKMSL